MQTNSEARRVIGRLRGLLGAVDGLLHESRDFPPDALSAIDGTLTTIEATLERLLDGLGNGFDPQSKPPFEPQPLGCSGE